MHAKDADNVRSRATRDCISLSERTDFRTALLSGKADTEALGRNWPSYLSTIDERQVVASESRHS